VRLTHIGGPTVLVEAASADVSAGSRSARESSSAG